MATRGWKILSAQCGMQKMAKTQSPFVTPGHLEKKESNSSPASLCQTGFVPWPACPNKASKNANCARSHSWDFACCPADSAVAASVAVRLPASECPVGCCESVARFASCVATLVISPFTSRPCQRFLRANAWQHGSAHHPAADRVHTSDTAIFLAI